MNPQEPRGQLYYFDYLPNSIELAWAIVVLVWVATAATAFLQFIPTLVG